MTKDKIYIHAVFAKSWFKGFLEGSNVGTWSQFKTMVLRKLKEDGRSIL